MSGPPENLDEFQKPEVLGWHTGGRLGLYAFSRPGKTEDTIIDVFGVFFYIHSSIVRERINIYEGVIPQRYYAYDPLVYKFVARAFHASGRDVFGIYSKGMINPPGHMKDKHFPHKIATFHSLIRAAYGEMQQFPDMAKLRAMYNLAVMFDRYLWLGKYLDKCLRHRMNAHLWRYIHLDTIENLKMAENLGIKWLYREIFIHICGQFVAWKPEERERLKKMLNPRSFALLWKIYNRSRHRLNQAKVSARDFYVYLIKWAESHGMKEQHAYARDVAALYGRLCASIPEYAPGGSVTDGASIHGFLNNLMGIWVSSLPAMAAPLVRSQLQSCIMQSQALCKSQLQLEPRPVVSYLTSCFEDADKYPWEVVEVVSLMQSSEARPSGQS